MADAIVPARTWIDIHLVILNDNLIGLDIVRELVEGAAALQVEASVVPMASKDAVADAALMEREAHLRAAVVDGVDRVGPGWREDGDAMPPAGDDGDRRELVAWPDAHERIRVCRGWTGRCGCHYVLLIQNMQHLA